jgi:tRNA nucleotidyltransferase (CCA-adding enzyme)
MNIVDIVPCELFELAKLFPKESHLYIVGGFIRDYLVFNTKSSDIDICASLTPDELQEILKESKFKLFEASPRLGTMIVRGERSYEYTTFRKDSYPKENGVHSPDEVVFTKDIIQDAKRRDFKCNAIYFDLNLKEIYDPLQGVEDISKKEISTVVDPNIVLSQDGLRIMRLVRMVSKLDFSVQELTLDAANCLKNRLKDISVERIQVELEKILEGAYVYKALCLMDELNLFEIILPELTAIKNKKDLLFRIVEKCPTKMRLAALFSSLEKENIRKILHRLKFSNEKISYITEVAGIQNCHIEEEKNIEILQKFVVENVENIEDIIFLQNTINEVEKKEITNNLEEQYDLMKKGNLPLRMKELKIDGKDVQKYGYKGKEIGNVLNEIFCDCYTGKLENKREKIIERLEKRGK